MWKKRKKELTSRPGTGGKEKRGRTSKLTNLSFVSPVSCAQANGTRAFIQPRPDLFLELEPMSYGGQSACVQRRHPRRGGCFARRDKCPRGGCPRRHPAARRAASTPRGVGRGCGTHCGGTSSRRSREADRGVALGWPRRGCYAIRHRSYAIRHRSCTMESSPRALVADSGRRRRGRPARGRARGARAARRELGVLGGRRGGWQECERVSRRQR